ncbi:MAG: trigger factor [Proteobacteria bacterium]|nr:trigger factor [Pseudomonadota bacterium]
MKVSIEKQADIARKITITIDADIFDKAVKTQLARFSKNARIPGFRKGKVPQKMLEQQFGGASLKEAIDNLINEYYPKALQQEELIPASLLNISPTQVERGKDFVFDVEIEVYPEIDTPDLKGESIEQVEVEVADEDIDRTLANIQKRRTEFTESDKAAGEGDKLIIDFTGTIDGEPFTGGNGEGAELVLGEGRFMEEFETNLTGTKKGDEKVFKIKFPKDYHGTDVAGKTAEFAVKVTMVNQGTLPELDDAFAKGMGVDGGVAAMRVEVRTGLEREMQQKLRSSTRDQVFKALSEKYDFPLPKAPVEEEIDRAMAEVTQQMEQQGMSDAKDVLKRENYEAPSKQRVKLGLLIRAVVEAEKIEPDNDKVESRLAEMAGSYAEPEQYIEYIRGDENQLNQIAGGVIEEQVVEHLLASAKVKKVEKSYEEFMTSE